MMRVIGITGHVDHDVAHQLEVAAARIADGIELSREEVENIPDVAVVLPELADYRRHDRLLPPSCRLAARPIGIVGPPERNVFT